MSSRPILNVDRSRLDAVLEIISVVGIVSLLLLLIREWSTIPDIIPIHFDIFGRPDGTGSKLTILIFPALAIASYALLTAINRFPHTFNYPWPITEENAYRQYQIAGNLMRWLKLELIWLCGFIEWQMILASIGKAFALNWILVLAIVLIIYGTVGYYLWQAYRHR